MRPAAELLQGLTEAQAQLLVKRLQRLRVVGYLGQWQDYLQARVPDAHLHDPSRHHREVLEGFVQSVLDHEEGAQEAGGAASGRGTAIVRRFVKWHRRVEKEKRMGATSMPPFKSLGKPQQQQQQQQPVAEPSASAASPDQQPKGGRKQKGGEIPWPSDQAGRIWALVHATWRAAKNSSWFGSPTSYLPGWARTKRRRVEPVHANGGAPASASNGVPNGAAKAGSEDESKSEDEHEESVIPLPPPTGLPLPRLYALDCEMCETTTDTSALIALSVVDEQGKAVYQTLVRPRDRIIDYRTEFTGVTPEDMKGVTTTRSQARRAIKELLVRSVREGGPPAVLVGHDLRNDLKAVRLDHFPIIDTALIFSYAGFPECTPALRALSKQILGQDMASRLLGHHDHLEDAAFAMRLVQHEVAQPCRTPPIQAPKIKVEKSQLSRLMLFRLPPDATIEELLSIFKAPPEVIAAAKRAQKAAPTPDDGDQDTAEALDRVAQQETVNKENGEEEEEEGEGSGSDKESESEDSDSGSGAEGHSKRSTANGRSSSGASSDRAGGGMEVDGEGRDAGGARVNGALPDAVTPSNAAAPADAQVNGNGSASKPPQEWPVPVGFQGRGISEGKAVLMFKTIDDANLAFKLLPGKTTKDLLGRPCKQITLSSTPPGGAGTPRSARGKKKGRKQKQGDKEEQRYLKVRKMAGHAGLVQMQVTAEQQQRAKQREKQQKLKQQMQESSRDAKRRLEELWAQDIAAKKRAPVSVAGTTLGVSNWAAKKVTAPK